MAVQGGYANPDKVALFGTGPCKASCPAHISIAGYIGAITHGKYEEGLRLIKEQMPFPGICGRVCPHPCEETCSRGPIDQPVSIMNLKRFLADMDLASASRYIPEIKENKGDRVAVVGSGPAGLSAAYYLAIEGYSVTVFEKLPVAGGMMAVGIPEYRLPRSVLQAETDSVKDLGVEILPGMEIGKDISLAHLRKEFGAVFLGIGCHRPFKLGIHGEDDIEAVVDGLAFLRGAHLGNTPKIKKRLVVIGGGNVAVDCARVGKRLGFGSVKILYRRTREEMPAYPWEVEETLEEGIDIQFLTAPVRLMKEGAKLSGVECIRMSLGEPDASGRRRPVPVEGSEFLVEADLLVPALGQTADLSFLSDDAGINTSPRGLIVADPVTGVTNTPGIFAGGDAVSGPRTVVEAVAVGKEAAKSIDRYLSGKDIEASPRPDWKGLPFSPEDPELREMVSMPRLAIAERKRTFKEIDLGFSEEQARQEAARCLRICGIPSNKIPSH
jgi:NADPH-dependent glutamate synthase beta subunit-like oxidoreductase